MKVIFIASGNKSVGTVSAFVQSQFESLQKEGLDMLLFPVVGKGWKSYAKAIFKLRSLVKKEKPDIVHAHYSTCGIVASLACLFLKPKIVVSILGSFPRKTFKLRYCRFFIKHIWDATITKSRRTANQLGLDLPVIPNGVNLEQFKIIDQNIAREICGFEKDKKYIIWCSTPSRSEKRFWLAQKAVELLNNNEVVLYPVYNKSHDDVVNYMCAADVLLLTSSKEGSPNVIKEAMACNCPIVSTDVGDVKDNTTNLQGAFVSTDDSPQTLASCLKQALTFNTRTKGREHLIGLELTTQDIARKIINQYKTMVL